MSDPRIGQPAAPVTPVAPPPPPPRPVAPPKPTATTPAAPKPALPTDRTTGASGAQLAAAVAGDKGAVPVPAPVAAPTAPRPTPLRVPPDWWPKPGGPDVSPAALRKAPPVVDKSMPGGWDNNQACYRLIEKMGASAAMGLVIAARGGDFPGQITDRAQQFAVAELQHKMGLKTPPNMDQLRDMDHYLNNYQAIQGALGTWLKPEADDGGFTAGAKLVGRVPIGAAMATITLLYSAGKAIGQSDAAKAVYFDPLDMFSFGKFNSTSDNTSKASWHEVAEGLKGVAWGIIDPTNTQE